MGSNFFFQENKNFVRIKDGEKIGKEREARTVVKGSALLFEKSSSRA